LAVLLGGLLTAALVVGVVAGPLPGWFGGLTGLTRSRLLGDEWRPALPADLSTQPLGSPMPPPEGAGGYALMHVQDDGTGRPVSWDPCRPVHVVIRPDGEVPGGPEALDWALDRIRTVTGLQLVVDGVTDEAPQAHRPAADQDRYGQRWSPVLIAWTDEHEYAGMSQYAALGGPVAVDGDTPGTRRYVSGVVLLNRVHLAEVAGRADGQHLLRAVILHEVGHLVGLDHIEDDHELMSPRPGVTSWDLGPGDLRGLTRLGRGPCYTDF
jgi:hypothetical protein